MASDPTPPPVADIGETAGRVWEVLDREGPLTLAKLVKAIDRPRDMSMQAVGWLAREGKVDITVERRSRVVTLR